MPQGLPNDRKMFYFCISILKIMWIPCGPWAPSNCLFRLNQWYGHALKSNVPVFKKFSINISAEPLILCATNTQKLGYQKETVLTWSVIPSSTSLTFSQLEHRVSGLSENRALSEPTGRSKGKFGGMTNGRWCERLFEMKPDVNVILKWLQKLYSHSVQEFTVVAQNKINLSLRQSLLSLNLKKPWMSEMRIDLDKPN